MEKSKDIQKRERQEKKSKVTIIDNTNRHQGATSRDSVSCCKKKFKGCWKKGGPKRSRDSKEWRMREIRRRMI
jgi:hypothetical protein